MTVKTDSNWFTYDGRILENLIGNISVSNAKPTYCLFGELIY